MRIPILQIETTNACNARCAFCAVPHQKLRRAPIGGALFSKIIDDAKNIGVTEIMPFLNGEPMLDSKFIERIAEINEKIPNAHVSFFSNGSLLSKDKAKELSGVKISGINFSINAISDSARVAVMGLPLSETIENILAFKDICPDVNISVSGLMDTTYWTAEEMQEFTRFWREKGIKPSLFFNGNWAGKTRKVCNVSGGCGRPDSVLTVLSNGNVALCCYDLEGEVTFGNLKDKNIAEVWNSEELENYRLLNDLGRRSELKLCKDCTTG
jgi:radical SAM protein with 4Fe4S-binding SPASM domain